MALMAIMGALGMLGAIVFGVLGLGHGETAHLEQIYAVAFFFMALGGLVGLWAQRSDRVQHVDVHPAHA